MFNKLRIAMAYSILLVVMLSIAGCGVNRVIGCFFGNYSGFGNIEWRKASGSVKCTNDFMVLGDSECKTEMVGDNFYSADLDCEFELEFDRGLGDSSVGLVYWYHDEEKEEDQGEYGITFRGGTVKVVAAGDVKETVVVESYVGKRIEVHLKASDEQLLAEIDGDTWKWPNTYWERRRLKPRLNADIGDTITLYSSSCTTQ
jgi:hypothetical protein